MNEFVRRMEVLRRRFVERAQADDVALAQAWAIKDRSAAKPIAHSLAGSAGLFGFDALSALAHDLERALDAGEPDSVIEASVLRLRDAIPGGEG